MRRSPLCWAVVVAVLMLSTPVPAQEMRRVGRAPAMMDLHQASAPNPQTPINMVLMLRQRQEADLAALIAAQSDPGSPDYRRWLSPQQFAERFGASADDYARMVDWLSGAGFAVRTWPNRLRIDFSGSVEQVERAFQVTMRRARRGDRRGIANGQPPAVPADLAESVAAVRLHSAPLAEPLVRVGSSAGAQSVMGPRDMHLAYNLQPLLEKGLDGSGQIIAVVARSDFNADDTARFRSQYGLPPAEAVKVFPGANPGIGSVNGVCRDSTGSARQTCLQQEKIEVLLDAQWAGALAPGATVLVDIADTDIDGSLADIVNHHPEAKVITLSFGLCERLDGGDSAEIIGPLYAQAVLQGQTIFVASGDNGADDCRDAAGASVNALSSDPNVTSVGGTSLDPGFDSAGNASGWVSERVWNDRSGASGGGHSATVPKPDYQNVLGVPDDGKRDQPDVAILGSPLSPGYVVIVEGAPLILGGTSVSAPAWAGIAAVLAQASSAEGLGRFNSELYGAGRKQYGFNAALVFHDITSGHLSFNGLIGPAATVAYDLASGLGTPDVAALARVLTACPGDCNGDEQVTVDELVLGVKIALDEAMLAGCVALDTNSDGAVTSEELVAATAHALGACPSSQALRSTSGGAAPG